MEPTTTPNPRANLMARALALLALGAAVVIIGIVIAGSLGDDDSGERRERRERPQRAQQQKPDQQTPKTYVVQPGDSLGAIAEETGVSVEELQRLNPNVDPQALPSGASLKLR